MGSQVRSLNTLSGGGTCHKSMSITARSGHSPLPGQRRPQHCRDNSLPVQDNPIQSNHLLNNWREASPHTADPNLNVPTTWGKSSGSGNAFKKDVSHEKWENTELLSKGSGQDTVYSRDASKLYENYHLRARQTLLLRSSQGQPMEPSTMWYLGIVLPSLHCQAMCASLSECHNTREDFLLHHQSRKELSTAFYPSTHLCRDLGQRLPKRTPVRIDPGNIPQHTHQWGTFWVVVWLFKGKIPCYDKETVLPIY